MAEIIQPFQRRLALNASDVRSLTGWPDAMVEDYINILEDLLELINNFNQLNIEAATVVFQASSAFSPTGITAIYEVDCTDGDVTVPLPSAAIMEPFQVAFRKVDSTANRIIVTGLINGQPEKIIRRQYSIMNLYSNGTEYGIA